jgi:mannose-1-phosphate guanylyltransferase
MQMPWSIVLAGGEGSRLRPFTERWLGRHVPKQYCAFSGTRTMLDDALGRAERLSGAERTVTVVAREHDSFAQRAFAGRKPTKIVRQPRNKGTAPGIYLPLTYVRKCEPDAVVVVLPSDHFLQPEDLFLDTARVAVQAAQEVKDRIVLIGAPPDSPQPDYGWLSRGEKIGNIEGRPVHAVQDFIEKPQEDLAKGLFAAGALWNTFILAARAETLWDLGWEHADQIMSHFERLDDAIGAPEEENVLDAIYDVMPDLSFSSAILERARGRVAMIELDGVAWSDWGRPDRIVSTLTLYGMPPAFSTTLIDDLAVCAGRQG